MKNDLLPFNHSSIRKMTHSNNYYQLSIFLLCLLVIPVLNFAQFPSTFELSNLCGPNGFTLNGIDADDDSGFSVSSAGDVNGDGIDDLVIGAPNGNGGAGESYVVFGSAMPFPESFDLNNLNGTNGFVLNGVDGSDESGSSVSSAGDVNGDGIDDLIIGAPRANTGAGESYIIFGSAMPFPAAFDLNNLNGMNGFVLNGVDGGDESGSSVSSAGDVNGDGIDDLIIGALFANPNGNTSAGESYVVFGSNTLFPSSFELSTLNGMNGFVLNGVDGGDESGISVSAVGDVNGDGIDDLIIGAPRADLNGNTFVGESYVVFGSTTAFASPIELSSLNGINGFVLNGIDAIDLSGVSVSSAGDVNGDGIDDLIIGTPFANGFNARIGESYVVFGNAMGFPSSFDLSTLNGTNGFVLTGIDAFDASGVSVSSAGDVNGDGIDDLIIGAVLADSNGNTDAGESYVVFGSTTTFTSRFDLATLNGMNGFVLKGIDVNDRSGNSVSSAGDVNGDGIDDLIIGAPNGNNTGESYVVFGSCGPSLFVNGGNTFIPNCADNPQLQDLTLFEGVCSQSYVLDNTKGTVDLIINAIASSNPAFTIGLGGFPLTIPAGTTLALPIGYTSTGNTTELSTITIDNNDCNDLTYSFTIQSPDDSVFCEQCNAVTPIFIPNGETIKRN